MTTHHDKIAELTKRLEQWDYKIDRIQHRLNDLPEELKEKAQQAYDEMVGYREQLLEKQQTLVESSEQTFRDIESSIDGLWTQVKQVFKDAKKELEEHEL